MSNTTSKRLKRVWALLEEREAMAEYEVSTDDLRAALEGGDAWAALLEKEPQIKESQ